MEIRFTNHAKYRILERGIKMANIKLTLKNPDYCDYAFDDKILVGKSISGKTLEVVYSKIRNKILVITVYYS